MTIHLHPKAQEAMLSEDNFKLFKHAGYVCCAVRMGMSGAVNGYVAIPKEHSLYGKDWSDSIPVKHETEFNGNYIGALISAFEEKNEGLQRIDCLFNVHGGITYSRPELIMVDSEITGDVWWFGFDTAHADDLRPFQTHIDRQYPIGGDEYRSRFALHGGCDY